jgi:hypothetical protein
VQQRARLQRQCHVGEQAAVAAIDGNAFGAKQGHDVVSGGGRKKGP